MTVMREYELARKKQLKKDILRHLAWFAAFFAILGGELLAFKNDLTGRIDVICITNVQNTTKQFEGTYFGKALVYVLEEQRFSSIVIILAYCLISRE